MKRQLLIKFLVIALLLPVSYAMAREIMDKTPLQIENADMLPIIKTMSKRFLNGQWGQVYQPIPEIWNGVQPIYLPAMWLPFTCSLIFDFDMRWITLCGIWLSIILCVLPFWKKPLSAILFSLSILSLLAWLHFDETNNVIRLTEEGPIFFYYTLVTIAIISRNPWFTGITAALCLLSRYAVIGWIPFAGLYFLITRQYQFLWKIIMTGAGTTVLILILPFGWKPLLYQFQLQQHYVSHAERVWRENPEFYLQSLGMAKLFVPSHISLLHSILLWGTFIVPLPFLIFLKKKLHEDSNILLAGFQLSITFFYNFLDVSYLYLYYTPVFVGLAIAGWLLTGDRKNN